jgi:PKHD-type hydroxylase
MYVLLEKVLGPADVAGVAQFLRRDELVDGRATSEHPGKRNLQLPNAAAGAGTAAALILRRLQEHRRFDLAAQPRVVIGPSFNRYEPGMVYPEHVDQALMGGRRTDLSVTIFLSEPADYDGGALVVGAGTNERRYRLAAGDGVLYPSSTLHRVEEVTRGARLAVVLWVESRVRDANKRLVLDELGRVVETLGDNPYDRRLRKAHANLLRMWVDT